MLVAPSVLSANFGHLQKDIQEICQAGADLVHVDVMDGHFVPNLTIGPLVVRAIKEASSKPLDVHLMVENVSFFVELYKDLASYISFHIEEEKHPHKIIQTLRSYGISPAITLNPHTRIEDVEHLLLDLDMVLLMSVNPGFGGQKFLPLVLEKVERLKNLIIKKGAKTLIEVDGGVSDKNIDLLKQAGCDIVVAGNYVFSSSDRKKAIESLK